MSLTLSIIKNFIAFILMLIAIPFSISIVIIIISVGLAKKISQWIIIDETNEQSAGNNN